MSTVSQQRTRDQAIALAGLLQCTYMVDLIARTGSAPAESFNPSLHSLFMFDADSAVEIYGGVHGIKLGLRVLHDLCSGNNQSQYRQVLRYGLGVLYLEKQLSKNPDLFSIIHNRLKHAAINAEHFAENQQAVASTVAGIYQDTVSTLKYRIQITGSMQQLQNEQNADCIRALLLAAVRATVLWRQLGGTRWQLVFGRGKLLKEAKQLMDLNS